MSKAEPWTYEHWHRWTPRKTIKTKAGYEMLERCRGCGELRVTLVTQDAEKSFLSATRRKIPLTLLTSRNDVEPEKPQTEKRVFDNDTQPDAQK